MKIIQYPHPTLRHKSQPIRRVDAELREMVDEMFALMYEAKGVGLAANQVDLPLRLFIANLSGRKEEGEELVFINPVVSMPKGTDEAEEGCLSLPGVYAQVKRPKQVRVQAYNLQGQELNEEVSGFLSRVIQHETDHLDGVLFIDRLADGARRAIQPELQEFEAAFTSQRETGEIAADLDIVARLGKLQELYCA